MTTVAAPRHRVQPPQTLTELVEDTEWLVVTGECWTQAVRRLGYGGRPDTLERRLHRAGRYDLITALRRRENTNPDRPEHDPRAA